MAKSYEVLEAELEKMAFKEGASVIMPIDPHDIVVGNWVRLKCQYGCPSYAKKLSCPPYSPTPEDTRKVLEEYSKAYLIGYSRSIFDEYGNEKFDKIFPKALKKIRKSILELEKHVFLLGYYKSFTYGFCGPCTLCKQCSAEDGDITCKLPKESRPSMEAAGMDVFKTVRNAGLELEVQSEINQDDLRMYTLLLLE
jgi:predicted metal-binding protein